MPLGSLTRLSLKNLGLATTTRYSRTSRPLETTSFVSPCSIVIEITALGPSSPRYSRPFFLSRESNTRACRRLSPNRAPRDRLRGRLGPASVDHRAVRNRKGGGSAFAEFSFVRCAGRFPRRGALFPAHPPGSWGAPNPPKGTQSLWESPWRCPWARTSYRDTGGTTEAGSLRLLGSAAYCYNETRRQPSPRHVARRHHAIPTEPPGFPC